jgi:hypothetical protein
MRRPDGACYNRGMSRFSGLGFGVRGMLEAAANDRTEFVLTQRPLQRILAFTRRSIDDVVNDPIAKREVLGYYKLSKQIARAGEVRELESQWNSVA